MNPDQKNIDPRFNLANERTFLAWVRTSIAIIAFGFVVFKFSLFLKHLKLFGGATEGIPEQKYSSITGVFLVISGLLILLLALIKYKRSEKELKQGIYRPSFGLINLLTITIISAGIFLVAYLLSHPL